MENTASLDSEELLHLALKASQDKKTENSIEYLKRAIHLAPNYGKAYYLLGALHAELGLFDRAIAEITKAVELEPSLDAAHFQLGLLYITSGQAENAAKIWKALDPLGENHPFWLFKEGMLALADDAFEQCIELLERGIALNTLNNALNEDMKRVIEKARSALESRDQDSTEEHTAEQTVDSETLPNRKHILLSAYNSDNDEENKH